MYKKSIFSHARGLVFRDKLFPLCSEHLNIQTFRNVGFNNSSIVSLNLYKRGFCSTSSLASSSSFFQKITTVHADSSNTKGSEINNDVEYIPLPPEPPEPEVQEVILNSLGEQTFESLGLAGWTPAGLIRQGLELIHVGLDVPWWLTIAIATAILRTCVFPLVIKSQKNAAKMNNVMPKMQALQVQMTQARTTGNHLEASKTALAMQQILKKEGVQPFKNVLVPLAQAPIFVSMFIGLRGCANLPVESFKTGGILWFTDLTIPDPYFLLPVMTSLTLLATLELGVDGQRLNTQSSIFLRYGFRALPFIIFPFTLNFSSAILCYWLTTNVFSLGQVAFLKIPGVREYFGIQKFVKLDPSELPQSKKGFMEGMKESWSNMKVSSEIMERQRIDEKNFKKAGHAPKVKTYKTNPLLQKPINVKAKVKNS